MRVNNRPSEYKCPYCDRVLNAQPDPFDNSMDWAHFEDASYIPQPNGEKKLKVFYTPAHTGCRSRLGKEYISNAS